MGSLGEARAVRRQFWLLIRAGQERRKAALALGLSDWTGKAWFRQAGGVIPAYVTAPMSGRFLSEEERMKSSAASSGVTPCVALRGRSVAPRRPCRASCAATGDHPIGDDGRLRRARRG